jgi:hypothetical protein
MIGVFSHFYNNREDRGPFQFSCMDYFSLKYFFTKFSRLDLTPRYYHAIPLFGALCKHGVRGWLSFVRFVKANQIPSTLIYGTKQLPAIEILIVVAKKDFITLPIALTSAIKNSLNPVSGIKIVTTSDGLRECKSLIERLELKIPIFIEDEEKVVPANFRTEMRSIFGRKYGWGLQQFLTVESVLNSSSPGVLALNADTILLRPQIWLNSNLNQVLLQSSELHEPYYSVLDLVFPNLLIQKVSHITHHMLFQPDLLREIFRRNGLKSTEDLFHRVKGIFNANEESPFCVEFEPYAQGMRTFFPERFQLRRFSNASIKVGDSMQDTLLVIKSFEDEKKYNSISLHSWNS